MSAPNPPAFPPAITSTAAGDVYHGYDGMSLRDYLAGQAITICLKDMALPVSEWAREAYRIADAMLAIRESAPDPLKEAAPDLLAIATAIDTMWTGWDDAGPDNARSPQVREIWHSLRAAIAKALGRTPNEIGEEV